MNRGLKTYLKDGIRNARLIYKKNKVNYFKFLLWKITSLFGKLFIFSYPAFALMDIKAQTAAYEKQNIDLLRSYEGTDNKSTFLTLLMGLFFKVSIYLAGVFIFVLMGLLMGGLGYLIGYQSDVSNHGMVLTIGFALPAVICVIAYTFIFGIYFAPVNFIISKRPEFNISQALYTSAGNMKKDGKKTVFLLMLINLALHIAYVGISFAICFACIKSSAVGVNILGYILIFLLSIFYIIFSGNVSLAYKIAIIKLFEDIISLDIAIENQDNNEVIKEEEVTKSKKKKKVIETRTKEEILLALFDDKNYDKSEEVEEKEAGVVDNPKAKDVEEQEKDEDEE